MRVGLLTRFMGILGVIVGVLFVIPLGSQLPIVQCFWLIAVGLLILGRWPRRRPAGVGDRPRRAVAHASSSCARRARAPQAGAGREAVPDDGPATRPRPAPAHPSLEEAQAQAPAEQ